MRHWNKFALVAALAAALPACNSSDAPPPQLPPPSAEPATQQPVQAPQNGAADHLEHSALDSAVPFVLTIDIPQESKTDEKFVIVANIDAPRKLNVPAKIMVTLPKGVSLNSGQGDETLAFLPGGITKRVFEVSGKVDQANPVKVSVQVKDPNGAFGAFAERQFPEKQPMKYKPSSVPKPPVSRPGAGIKAATGARTKPQFQLR